MRLIVNADDLGLSVDVNAAIFELMGKGRVTSASLVANGDAIEEALKRTAEFPECSFGAHLNATTGRPLTGGRALEGLFQGKTAKIPFDGETRAALVEEFKAQVEKLQAGGVKVSHIDSHHHIHLRPALFPVVKRVQRHFGIPAVRISMNVYAPDEGPGWAKAAAKRGYNWALRNLGGGVKTVDASTDFRTFLAWVERGREFRFRTMELMTHPGASGPKYAAETAALEGSWLDLVPGGGRLISYHRL